MGIKYASAEPPTRVIKNCHSCQQFSQFVTDTILQSIDTGAIRVCGRVGEVRPSPPCPPDDDRAAEAKVMY